jgi:hypothetical protein
MMHGTMNVKFVSAEQARESYRRLLMMDTLVSETCRATYSVIKIL